MKQIAKRNKMDLVERSEVRTPRIGSSGARATFEKTESMREGIQMQAADRREE